MPAVDRALARVRVVDLRLVDALVAALLVGATLDQVLSAPDATPASVLAAATISATVGFRRMYARGATVAGLVAGTVLLHAGDRNSLAVAPIVLVLDYYAVGRRSAAPGGRWTDLGLVALGAAFIASIPEDATVVGTAAVWSFFIAAPFAAGRAIAGRTALARELAIANERLEAEQRDRTRRATVLERTRIARELHDVIAHSVSVMVIQAGAARSVFRDDPGEAREALLAVQGAGRDALAELRQVVGVLERGDPVLGRTTTPGLAQLTALVERARASGLPVDVETVGAPRALAPDVDLVAYRVVQEALTNAIKHAGPARAVVRVEYCPEALELDISDTGTGPADAIGGGHGLVGMRERLAMFGGDLRAGSRPGGGFEVSARLPLADEVPA